MKRIQSKLLFCLLMLLSVSCGDNDKSFTLKGVAKEGLTSGITGVPLAGKTVGQLLDKFHEMASQLLFEGENRGNALLQAAANKIDIATQNANIALQDQQDRAFESLSKESQRFFTELNLMLNQTNESVNRAITVLEVANLDLMELTSQLPLTEKVHTYMNLADGMCQVHSKGDYQVRIVGLGFGQDLENVKYKIVLKLAGHQIPAQYIARKPKYSMVVTIPHDSLERYFKADSLQSVPFSVDVTADARERCGLVFHCNNTVTARWDLTMILMPLHAGVIEGVELIKGQALDGKPQIKEEITTSGDGDSWWSREITVAANQRIIEANYRPISGMVGWSYASRKLGREADFDIVENSTKAIFYRHTQGPATVAHYVKYETLVDNETERPIQPIQMEYGNTILLPLSKDNTGCVYRIRGKLVTGQEFYIDNSMSHDAMNVITRVSTGPGNVGFACQPAFMLTVR